MHRKFCFCLLTQTSPTRWRKGRLRRLKNHHQFAFSFSQNASDVEGSEKHYKFEMKRVLLQYDEANSLVTEHYHIFMTRSKPHSIIKSSKSGRAFLDKTTNWKDCGAWFTLRTVSNHWENVCLFYYQDDRQPRSRGLFLERSENF